MENPQTQAVYTTSFKRNIPYDFIEYLNTVFKKIYKTNNPINKPVTAAGVVAL